MKKLERLFAIVEHLRSKKGQTVTVPELAEQFEVTERTVHRDLASLRDQDVPINGEPGRNGGVWLGDEYAMPPVGLSIGETIGLWLAFRLGTSASTGLAGESLSVAMSKVLATLPDERRRQYESVLDRIVIGVPPDPRLLTEVVPVPSEVYRQCELAVVESRRLRISYVDGLGAVTERELDPYGILIQAPIWYLLAFDHLRDAPRMFRLDRIKRADVDPVLRFQSSDPRELFKEIQDYPLELPN